MNKGDHIDCTMDSEIQSNYLFIWNARMFFFFIKGPNIKWVSYFLILIRSNHFSKIDY